MIGPTTITRAIRSGSHARRAENSTKGASAKIGIRSTNRGPYASKVAGRNDSDVVISNIHTTTVLARQPHVSRVVHRRMTDALCSCPTVSRIHARTITRKRCLAPAIDSVKRGLASEGRTIVSVRPHRHRSFFPIWVSSVLYDSPHTHRNEKSVRCAIGRGINVRYSPSSNESLLDVAAIRLINHSMPACGGN